MHRLADVLAPVGEQQHVVHQANLAGVVGVVHGLAQRLQPLRRQQFAELRDRRDLVGGQHLDGVMVVVHARGWVLRTHDAAQHERQRLLVERPLELLAGGADDARDLVELLIRQLDQPRGQGECALHFGGAGLWMLLVFVAHVVFELGPCVLQHRAQLYLYVFW